VRQRSEGCNRNSREIGKNKNTPPVTKTRKRDELSDGDEEDGKL